MKDQKFTNPIIASPIAGPEDTALMIRDLLGLVELACFEQIDRETPRDVMASRLHGCAVAVQVASQAVQWLGEMDVRRDRGELTEVK